MASCEFTAPNGKLSILYARAEAEFGPDKAEDIWYKSNTQQFLNSLPNNSLRDENGELDYDLVVNHLGIREMRLSPEQATELPTNLAGYSGYGGAAAGSDKHWADIGKLAKVGKQVDYTVDTLKKITEPAHRKIVEDAYQQAVKDLGRQPMKYNWDNPSKSDYSGGLVRRDYLQAKSADAIFAIGSIVEPGSMGEKYQNKTNKQVVDGGTGYAVQMAINMGKPINVFDQKTGNWYKWNYENGRFEGQSTPVLTPKYAGIGTRGLTEAGKQAIVNVFRKTLGREEKPITVTPEGEQVQGQTVIGSGAMIAEFEKEGVAITAPRSIDIDTAKLQVGKGIQRFNLFKTMHMSTRTKLYDEVDKMMTADSTYLVGAFIGEGGILKEDTLVLAHASTLQGKPTFVYATDKKAWYQYSRSGELIPTTVNNFIGNPYIYGAGRIPLGTMKSLVNAWKAGPEAIPIDPDSVAALIGSLSEDTSKELPIETDITSLKYYSIPVLGPNGLPTGEQFSDKEFDDIMDAMVQEAASYIRRNAEQSKKGRPTVSMHDVLNEVTNHLKNTELRYRLRSEGPLTDTAANKYANDMPAEEALAVADRLQKVIYSIRGNLAVGNTGAIPFLASRLNEMGFSIKGKIVVEDTGQIKEDVIEDGVQTAYSENNLSDTTEGTVAEEEQRGIIDYSKSAININPIDSASMRVKMFLAGIPECTLGLERPHKIARMPLVALKAELKAEAKKLEADMIPQPVYSVRTSGEVKDIGISLEKGGIKEGVVNIDGIDFRVKALLPWSADIASERPDIPINDTILKEKRGDKVDRKFDGNAVIYEITPFVAKEDIVAEYGNLGIWKAANFQRLFADLLTELGGVRRTNEDMINLLYKSESANIRLVAKRLDAANSGTEVVNGKRVPNVQLVNEFNKVMTQRYSVYNILMYKVDPDGSVSAYTKNANDNQAGSILARQWKENFLVSEAVLKKPNGEFMINKPLSQSLFDRMMEMSGKSGVDSVERNNLIKDTLDSLGIAYDPELFGTKGALGNKFTYKKMMKKTGLQTSIDDVFSYNKTTGKPDGLFSTIIARLNGIESGNVAESQSDMDRLMANNPYDTETRSIKALARMILRHNRTVIESTTHRSADNKSVYNYTLYSYQTRAFEDLQSEAYREKLKANKFNKGARLYRLLDNPVNTIKVSEVDGMKDRARPRADGKARQDQSDIEQEFMSLMMFQNSGLGWSSYMDMTKSDKTRTLMWENVNRMEKPVELKPQSDGSYKVDYSAATVKEFRSIFDSEFERICEWYQAHEQHRSDLETNPLATPPYNDERFDKGGGYFYLLPNFNYDVMAGMVAAGTLDQVHLDAIWVAKGQPAVIASENRGKAFGAIMRKTLIEMENNIKDSWEGKGLTNFEKKTNLFNDLYLKIQANGDMGISSHDADGREAYKIGDKAMPGGKNQYHDFVVEYAVKDYLAHNMVMYADIMRSISGDPAMAYKAPKDGETDMHHVISTMIEYQKRLAKDIAPGREPAFGPTETYRQLYLKDYKSGYNDMKAISEEVGKAYGKGINGTDAQEVVTVREHLTVMFKNGEIRDDVYNEMIAIVDAGIRKADKYYEFTKPEHEAVIMQIMKPVYVGTRFENGQMHINYIKSSAYSLYPPLTKGKEIDKLRVFMEGNFDENGLHQNHTNRAAFESASKMGTPLQAVELFKADGSLDENALSTQAARATHTLDRKNFRIQQDVPYDGEKEKILTPSQANKLIIAGLPAMFDGKPVYFGRGGTVKGWGDTEGWGDKDNVRMAKELIRKLLIKSQMKELLADIDNPKDLVERIKETAIGGGYSLNELIALSEIDEAGNPKIPFALSPVLESSEKLLMSMVTKATQVKVAGKSYVQASSAGISSIVEGIEGLEGDIIWAPGYNGEELQMFKTDAKGKKIATAQVLIPPHLLGTNTVTTTTKDGKVVTRDVSVDFESMMLQEGDEGYIPGKRILNTNKVDPKLLEMVGLRIPNQGHNSMLPLEIVGFLPANMGDMIVVPKGITTQMGSDFDVDKLYVMKRPYSYHQEPNEVGYHYASARPLTNITTMEAALEEEIEDIPTDVLQAAYFQIYWDILTAPAMASKVLSPLDKDDLTKYETKGLSSPMNYMQFLNPVQQNLSYTSQKDAKKLVATSSLFLTQMSQLEVADYVHLVTMVDNLKTQTVLKVKIHGKEIQLINLHGVGTSMYNGELRTKFDNLAIMQNAFLDHAKNPTADKLNLTTVTFPAAAVLSMLSTEEDEAVDLGFTAKLMRQPILVDFNSRMQRSTGSLGTERKSKKDIFAEMRTELENGGMLADDIVLSESILLEAFEPAKEFGEDISPEQMLLETAQAEIRKASVQASVLTLFEKLDAIAETLQKAQRALNYDSKGVGPNTLQAMDKKDIGDEVMAAKSGVVGLNQLFSGTEAGYIRNQANNALDALDDILNTKVQGVLNSKIKQLFGLKRIDESTGRTIRNGYKSFILSNLDFVGSAYEDRIRILHGEDAKTGKGSMVDQLRRAKAGWGRDNYFVQRLNVKTVDEYGSPGYIVYEAGVKDEYDAERIPSLWSKMIVSEDLEERKFAQDLFKYTMLLGGVQEANNVAKYIPSGYLIDSGIAEDMEKNLMFYNGMIMANEVVTMLGNEENRFLYQWAQNNAHKLQQLPDELDKEGNVMPVKEQYTLGTVFDEDFPEDLKAELTTPTGKVHIPVEIAAKYNREERKFYVYKASTNTDGLGTTYTRIDNLGSSYGYEYDSSVDDLRSAIPGNRSVIKTNGNYMGVSTTLDTGNIRLNAEQIIMNPMTGRSSGIKEGTYTNEDADDLLDRVCKMYTTPAPYQILGKALLPIIGYDRFFEGDQFQIDIMSDAAIRAINGGRTFSGGYIKDNNRIILNADSNTFAESFIHEALHSTSERTIEKMMKDPNAKKDHPEIYRHVMEFEQLRQAALKMFREQNPEYTDSRLEDIKRAKMDTSNNNDRIAYHLMSMDEMLTGALSNRTFQEWAAEQTYGDRSIISKISDWISGLIEAIGKTLGMPVPTDSVLRNAIEYALYISRISTDSIVTIDNAMQIADAPMDPKYELFPGVYANAEQRIAMDKLEFFFKSPQKQFLLSGAGGTGKTTIIQKIAKNIPGNVGYCAPTNAAKQTLAASGDIPAGNSFTVAQMLNMIPDKRAIHIQNADPTSIYIDQKKFRMQTDDELRKKRPPQVRRIKKMDVIIIDESSMVDDKLVALIHKEMRKDTKIVWMGDYAQLEPVGQVDEAWPFRELAKNSDVSAKLIKNERSRAQDIVAMVNQYRKVVNDAVDGTKTINLKPIPSDRRVNSKNVSFLKGEDDNGTQSTIIKVFQEQTGVRDAAILASTNKEVDTMNLVVRDALFGKGAEPFQVGERLLSGTNITEEKLDGGVINILANSEMAIVRGRGPGKTIANAQMGMVTIPFPITTYPIEIETEGGITREYYGMSTTDWKKVNDYMETIIKYTSNNYATLGSGQTMHYGDLQDARDVFESMYPSFNTGYAMTVHKSQGRTIKHTFVMEEKMAGGAGFSTKNKSKMLYTAVSRASEHLYIINKQNTFNPHRVDVASKVRDTEFGGLAGPYEFPNSEQARAKSAELKANYQGLYVHLYLDEATSKFPLMAISNDATTPALETLGSDIRFNPSNVTVDPTQLNLERLVGELRNRHNQLLNAKRQTTDPAEKAKLQTQIDEANAKLTELEGSLEIGTMISLAKHQLQWVEKLLSGKVTATGATVNYAVAVANIWQNITHSIYEDQAHLAGKDIILMQGLATNMLDRLMPMAKDIILKYSNGSLNTEDMEFASLKNKDGKMQAVMSAAAKYTRDLSQVDSKFGQQMAHFLQDAAGSRNEGIRRLQSRIAEYDRLYDTVAAQMGISKEEVTKLMLQETGEGDKAQTHWGLVREYSRGYWDEIEKIQRNLEADIADPNITRDQAFRRYNKDNKEISLLVNVNLLADNKTGKLKISMEELEAQYQEDLKKPAVKGKGRFRSEVIMHYAELRKETPSLFMVQKLLLRTENYLETYHNKYKEQVDGLQAQVSANEMKSADAKRALKEWVETNSPYYYLDYVNGLRVADSNVKPQGYSFIQKAPRKSYNNGALYDSKYWEIFKDYNDANPTDLQKLYTETSDMMKEFKDKLPPYISKKLGSNFLPSVKNSMVQEMKLDKTLLKTVPAKLVEMLTAEEDADAGKGLVPVRYIGRITAEEASMDLPMTLLRFGGMSMHYEHMSNIKDVVELGQHVINIAVANNARAAQGQNTSKEQAELQNLKDSISHFTEVIMMQRNQHLQYESNTKLYTHNIIKQWKISKGIRDITYRQEAIDKEYEDGLFGEDQYNALTTQLESERQQLFESQGVKDTNRKVYGSRIADFLIRYQALKSLSYNPISAVANVTFGMISMTIHGAGGQDFTNKETASAFGMMMSSSKRFASFGAWEGPMARKIAALVDRMNVLGEITDTGAASEVHIDSRAKGWGQRLGPYQIMRSSDFFAKGSIVVAMALAHKIEVVENGVTKTINLFEALNEDATWNEDRFGPNPDWYAENPADEKAFKAFQARAGKVVKKIMGNQDPNSPIWGKRLMLVRLFGQFRMSWMAEGFFSRFESERDDIALGRKVKGRYRTYADLGLAGSLMTLTRMIGANLTGADPYTNTLSDGRTRTMSDIDVANMKMNLMELQWGLGLAAAYAMFGFLLGEADDEDGWLKFVKNIMYRNFQDTIFYLDPNTAMDILRSPIPALSVITDIQKAIGTTIGEMTGEDPAELRRIILKWTKAGVPFPQTALINKFDYMMNENLRDMSKSR